MSHIWLATDAQEGGRDTNAASQLGEARGGDEAPNVDEMDRKSPASASLSSSSVAANNTTRKKKETKNLEPNLAKNASFTFL